MRICNIIGCGRRHKAYGLCDTHNRRVKVGLDLNAPVLPRNPSMTPAEKLAAYAPPGLPDECWEWTRGKKNGYGQMNIGGGSGNNRGAHVVAWELANGQSSPDGLVVRHACDNPPCCNPEHLVIGTYAQNRADSVERDRHARGERHGTSRLTAEEAIEIRAAHKNGRMNQFELSDEFHVSQPTISEIVNRKTWTHI